MNSSTVQRRTLAATVLVAVLALTACGDGDPPSPSPTTPGAATTSATFNAADVAFATDMIPHHRQATAMADHAAGRAGSASVRQLAARIRAAQDPEIRTMSAWLADRGKPVPSAGPTAGHGDGHAGTPGMVSDADMARMMASGGPALDRLFLTLMITHHEGAITMAKEELAGGSDPGARQLAGRIIDAQTAEIATMKRMLATG
ncbi:lipoprotein [Pilimelia anulata]|uniref:Lipoprotein n=1 Tax=Pilimelia anulata TaxID=53371 RepID=A0A8J3BBG7_9ACTN|nr:DUF305 domain-containing protein [Pilimelia anulata]GGK07060.1 lipoprotein [Pilimelia anulata]